MQMNTLRMIPRARVNKQKHLSVLEKRDLEKMETRVNFEVIFVPVFG